MAPHRRTRNLLATEEAAETLRSRCGAVGSSVVERRQECGAFPSNVLQTDAHPETLGALTVPKIATCLVATLFSIGAMFVLVGGSASATPKAPAAAGAVAAVAQASSSMSTMSSMSSISSMSSQSSQSTGGGGGATSSASTSTGNRSLAKTGTGLGFPLMLGSGGVLLAMAARAFLRSRAVV